MVPGKTWGTLSGGQKAWHKANKCDTVMGGPWLSKCPYCCSGGSAVPFQCSGGKCVQKSCPGVVWGSVKKPEPVPTRWPANMPAPAPATPTQEEPTLGNAVPRPVMKAPEWSCPHPSGREGWNRGNSIGGRKG